MARRWSGFVIRQHAIDPHCWYCGIETKLDKDGMHNRGGPASKYARFCATGDHVIPRTRNRFGVMSGPRKAENNMVLACRWCNQVKSDLTLDEFRKRVIGLDVPWASQRQWLIIGDTVKFYGEIGSV